MAWKKKETPKGEDGREVPFYLDGPRSRRSWGVKVIYGEAKKGGKRSVIGELERSKGRNGSAVYPDSDIGTKKAHVDKN